MAAAIWVLTPYTLNSIEVESKVTPAIDAHMCKDMIAPAFSDNYTENGKAMAVMATETDLRMFVQQGCFTIHSSTSPLNKHERHSEFLRRLVIPAGAASDIARELEVCGFRQGDIFPDLGHLAAELRYAHPPGWTSP